MAIHGTLKTMSLTDLLQFLAAGRKTGTLKFDRDKITKQIFFQNGLIAGSKSNDPREYLGQLLLHYGKLDEHQLQVAREVQRKSGGKLGDWTLSTTCLYGTKEISSFTTLSICRKT